MNVVYADILNSLNGVIWSPHLPGMYWSYMIWLMDLDMASSGFKASHVEAPYFVDCRDTTDCITNNLMLLCRHPFDGWMDHTFHGEFLWSTSGIWRKKTFWGWKKHLRRYPWKIQEQRAICLRCFSPRKYVLSDFSRELFLQLGCWRTRPKFWLFCRIG